MSGWEDPETAYYYEAFCATRSRYAQANAALIAHAHIEPGMRLLDLGAGTGRTTEEALPYLGVGGTVLCVEPSAAMRTAGIRRLGDPRVAWRPALPDANGVFDRILCGAAIWQMHPLADTFHALAGLLRPSGALCFTIPASHLLEPDEPGGGSDPWLLSLPALLMEPSVYSPEAERAQAYPSLNLPAVSSGLNTVFQRVESWSFRVRLTQEDYAQWLKIPVVTERLLGGLRPAERARRIDAALSGVDRASWKWEGWRGWTAWNA
jgi:SAM-dependent methyltransferase